MYFPGGNAILVCHKDSKSTDVYNQEISQRQEDAIRNYLVKKFGISADRPMAIGDGKSRLIATNDKEEGRHLQRRV